VIGRTHVMCILFAFDVSQAEKEQHAQALDSERRKMNHLRHRARDIDTKDQELRDLHGQLAELQVSITYSNEIATFSRVV